MAAFGRIGRGTLSVALIVVATALGVAGGVSLYARQQLIAPQPFADRATDALERDAVRRVVAREIVVQLIDRGSTDLISARPVIEEVVDFVVASRAFRRVFRTAAINGNRVLFVRDEGNVAFGVADAGTVVASALRSVAPDTAKRIPPDFDAQLLKLRDRSFATTTLRFADKVRFFGLLLPALSLLGFALAVVVAPDRRAAVTRSGIAVGAGCAMRGRGAAHPPFGDPGPRLRHGRADRRRRPRRGAGALRRLSGRSVDVGARCWAPSRCSWPPPRRRFCGRSRPSEAWLDCARLFGRPNGRAGERFTARA